MYVHINMLGNMFSFLAGEGKQILNLVVFSFSYMKITALLSLLILQSLKVNFQSFTQSLKWETLIILMF